MRAGKLLPLLALASAPLLAARADAAPSAIRVNEMSGTVDMASVGGAPTGRSRLRESSHGEQGGVTGELPTLRSTLPAVRACHEAALARGVGTDEIGVTVFLHIGAGGRVEKVEPETHGPIDAALLACVVSTFQPLRFDVSTRVSSSPAFAIKRVSYGLRMWATPASRGTDADKMCAAAQGMLNQGWAANRPHLLATLATRFVAAEPTPAGKDAMNSISLAPQAEIPKRWAKALVARNLSAPRCKAFEQLLLGDKPPAPATDRQ